MKIVFNGERHAVERRPLSIGRGERCRLSPRFGFGDERSPCAVIGRRADSPIDFADDVDGRRLAFGIEAS